MQEFGVIGLGVMGRNLALNVERNGISVAVLERSPEKLAEFLSGPAAGKRILGVRDAAALAAALQRPRRILAMVPAGAPVDAVLRDLRPHLETDDVVIDGGNSHYTDTDRRLAEKAQSGIRFVGMGVSG